VVLGQAQTPSKTQVNITSSRRKWWRKGERLTGRLVMSHPREHRKGRRAGTCICHLDPTTVVWIRSFISRMSLGEAECPARCNVDLLPAWNFNLRSSSAHVRVNDIIHLKSRSDGSYIEACQVAIRDSSCDRRTDVDL
jgi:hypothetical protein